MRRRVLTLVVGLCAAAALATPARAWIDTNGVPEGGGNPPPKVCVWSNGTHVGPYYVPVYVPYTCTPDIFR